MWLYHIPAYTDVPDLSAGDEIPFTNLAPFNADGSPTTGMFVQATNTFPSALPRAGTSISNPFVANDNHDPSLSDDGHALAFVSSRDLVTGGNTGPTTQDPPGHDNDEIFTYIQGTGINQVTMTPRGTLANPIYNKFPTISGPGTRIAFASTGDDPVGNITVPNIDCGSNPEASRNEEVFYADIGLTGAPTACKQVTTTTPTNPGDVVNILDPGRRMSRDGRYIAFDSFADLAATNGTNQTSFAAFLYDTTTSTFRQIGPRSKADAAATGGDIAHFPGFTDYDASGTATTLVFRNKREY